jgi:hypothetical protein
MTKKAIVFITRNEKQTSSLIVTEKELNEPLPLREKISIFLREYHRDEDGIMIRFKNTTKKTESAYVGWIMSKLFEKENWQ